MLFEHGCGEESGLQAVRLARSHDASEATQRRPLALSVVLERREITLHARGRRQRIHEPPLPPHESIPAGHVLTHAFSNNKSARGRQRAEAGGLRSVVEISSILAFTLNVDEGAPSSTFKH